MTRHAAPDEALQVASAQGVPGTAGALAQDATGTRYLLTNHHVAYGGGAEACQPIWALPTDRDADAGAEIVRVGTTHAGLIGRVTFAGAAMFVDCALVRLADESRFPDWLRRQLARDWPAATAKAGPGLLVRKLGSGTGSTEGTLVDVAYPDTPFIGGRSFTATGQLLVDPLNPERNFSAAGDSGSALLDEAGRVIGLIWGTNHSGQGIASPIAPVLDCLGVTLVGRLA